MKTKSAFNEAVDLLEQWGFLVQPGPRQGEVTLVLEGYDFRTYIVYEAERLPQVAASALQAEWINTKAIPTSTVHTAFPHKDAIAIYPYTTKVAYD